MIQYRIINKQGSEVTLAEWEDVNGILDIKHLTEWGKKNGLDANLVYKAIQDFRDRVVAGGYLYADYAAAFRTWHKDKHDDLKKQEKKPRSML
jgi:predicted GNAT family acetyltransferase